MSMTSPDIDVARALATSELLKRFPRLISGLHATLEYRNCGRNCRGCPHGPYLYVRLKSGKRRYVASISKMSVGQIVKMLDAYPPA